MDRLPDNAGDPGPGLPEEAEQVQAWEEIEPGRYMPRRIIGSFRGGQLG
jgi:hypothetical protein